MKPGAGGSDAGGRSGFQTSRGADKVEKLFRKYSGGDDQMDAAEFTQSLKDILGKGMRSGDIFGVFRIQGPIIHNRIAWHV